MSRYKVNVKVELIECDDSEQGDLTKNLDGSFSITLKRNKEHKRWFEKGEVEFKLAA